MITSLPHPTSVTAYARTVDYGRRITILQLATHIGMKFLLHCPHRLTVDDTPNTSARIQQSYGYRQFAPGQCIVELYRSMRKKSQNSCRVDHGNHGKLKVETPDRFPVSRIPHLNS